MNQPSWAKDLMGGGRPSKKSKAEDQITIIAMPKSNGGGGMSGFTGGGADGAINPMRRSGQVEEGEYVFNAAATKAIDPQVLDRLQQLAMAGAPGLNQKLQSVLGIPQQKSYATGGQVIAPPTPNQASIPAPAETDLSQTQGNTSSAPAPILSGVQSAGQVVNAPTQPQASIPTPAKTDFSASTSSVAPISAPSPAQQSTTVAPVGGTSMTQSSVLSGTNPPATQLPTVNPISTGSAPNYNKIENDSLAFEQGIMNGTNPYYNQLNKATLANYDANAAANNSLTAMNNASNPYMTTGAKNSASAQQAATTESGRVGLQSQLAQNAQAAEQNAATTAASMAQGIQANQANLATAAQATLTSAIEGGESLSQIMNNQTLRNNIAQANGIDPNNQAAVDAAIQTAYESNLTTNMSTYAATASTDMSTAIKNGETAPQLLADTHFMYLVAIGEGLDPNNLTAAEQTQLTQTVNTMYQNADALVNSSPTTYTQFNNWDGTAVPANGQLPANEQPGAVANVEGNINNFTNQQLTDFWNSGADTMTQFWDPTANGGKGAPNVSEILGYMNLGLSPTSTGMPDLNSITDPVTGTKTPATPQQVLQNFEDMGTSIADTFNKASEAVTISQIYPPGWPQAGQQVKKGDFLYTDQNGTIQESWIGSPIWKQINFDIASQLPNGVNSPTLVESLEAAWGTGIPDNNGNALMYNSATGEVTKNGNASAAQTTFLNTLSGALKSSISQDNKQNFSIKSPLPTNSAISLSQAWNNSSVTSQPWYGGNLLNGGQETQQGGVDAFVINNKGKIVQDPDTGRLYLVTGVMNDEGGGGTYWSAQLVDISTGQQYSYNATQPGATNGWPATTYAGETLNPAGTDATVGASS